MKFIKSSKHKITRKENALAINPNFLTFRETTFFEKFLNQKPLREFLDKKHEIHFSNTSKELRLVSSE